MQKPIIRLAEADFHKKDAFLRKRSEPVLRFDGNDLVQTVQNLTDTINVHEIAVGLSAVQIGTHSRVFVVDATKIEDATGEKQSERGIIAFINPKILRVSRICEKQMEACMSLPFYQGEVERPLKIKVAYQTMKGAPKRLAASGLLARVILHEVDHLDGILYIDRMLPDSKLIPVDFP